MVAASSWPSNSLVNEKVRNHWRGVDELYSFNLLCHANGQTHMCLITLSVKIIIKRMAVMYRFKSARMVSIMLRLICVFLGCDMPIQLVLSREYDDWTTMSPLLKYLIYPECFIGEYGPIIWVHILRNTIYCKTSTGDNIHVLGGKWLLAEKVLL